MINFDILEVLHSGKIILTDTICRMCLKPSSKMISIFDKIVLETECPISPKTSQTIQILELFEYFTQIQICDQFSNMVCKMCIKSAQDVYIFKTKVKEIDSWLHLNVGNLKMDNCKGKKFRDTNEAPKEQIYKISKTNILKNDNSSNKNTSTKPSYVSILKNNTLLQTKKNVHVVERNIKDIATETIIILDEPTKIDQRNAELVKKSLPEHLKDHDYDLIYCDLCDQYFPDQFSYKHHEKIHTIKQRKCTICNILLSRKGAYTTHMKSHARKAALHQMPVNIDDAFFPFIMNSDGEKSIKCELCGEIFTQFRGIEKHMRTAHLEGFIFGCHFCGEGFNLRLSLMEHLKSHIADMPYFCAHCPQKFNKMVDITNHVKTHNTDPLLINAAQENYSNNVDNVKEPGICSFCGKKFNDNYALRLHFKTHTEEKSFLCQLCGKAFITSPQLNIHLRIHDANKFMCNVCGQTYRQPHTLKVHMRSHTHPAEMKFYKCTLCEKQFKQSRSLRLHMKYHNNEALHQCNECGKAFVTKSSLKNHFTMHTNERPFTCKYCDKTFRKKFTLTCHINTHEGKKPYVCKICSMAFSRPDSLTHHTMRAHTNSTQHTMKKKKNSTP